MSVIEFICFSDFKQPQVDGVSGIENLTGFYSGNQLEDPTHGYLVFLWPSLEAQHAAKSNPAYTTLLTTSGSQILTTHIIPSPNPSSSIPAVFSSPVTEFAVAKLRSEDKREKWLEMYGLTVSAMGSVEGAIAGVHADRSEVDDGTFFFLIGWVSLEHHKAALSHPLAADFHRETLALTDYNTRHAALTKHL